MKLVRYLGITGDRKLKHRGPYAGGTFWALESCNDLPRIHVNMDLSEALKNGELWIQDAEKESGWQKVLSESALPKFRKIIKDDYEACCLYAVYLPYLPEFYWISNPEVCPKCGSENFFYEEDDIEFCNDCHYYKDLRL